MPIKLLVTGGRDYERSGDVFRALDLQHAVSDIVLVMTGACKTGVDAHAEAWAKAREIPYIGVPACWRKFGKSAGPRRNRAMLNFHGIIPDRVLAFPGGTGTADMCEAAKVAGVHVVDPFT